MAILASLPGIEVNVTIDGDKLREHTLDENLEPNNPTRTACYVASIAGHQYAIEVTIPPGYNLSTENALAFDFVVDGQRVRRWVIHKSQNEPFIYRFRGPLRPTANSDKLQRHLLTFATLTIVEGDSDVATTNGMGTIIVTVSKCRVRYRKRHHRPLPLKPVDLVVHEKQVKGKVISDVTRYTTSDEACLTRRKSYRSSRRETIGTYSFSYCGESEHLMPRMSIIGKPSNAMSAEHLKMMGIISRSSSPTVIHTEVPVKNEDQDPSKAIDLPKLVIKKTTEMNGPVFIDLT
ncbi:hypothetical protein QQS21_011889 [Conoideocrella luteorostrata]|uniref:DUF7918 domain-containing protein n=1 Tax=Conoideocrella luteorostrata TaxID=1105319 RepID=A0AAJ0FT89_9HYPO|nr:hypothetical protein QQS21_011889 [Conoideocrella luteorostrata]